MSHNRIREFEITDEIRNLGVSRICVAGKTLFVYNTSKEPTYCQYDRDDLTKTLNWLKKALNDSHEFDKETIDKLLIPLSQVWSGDRDDPEDISSGCLSCSSKQEWLESYLIDHLKQHLATYTELITNNEGKTTVARIYYDQAFQLLKIGAYKPAPPYVIKFSHLTSRLQNELNQLDDIDRIYVLKQAVSRIFEDINLGIYHNSVSRVLRVVLQR